MSFPERPINPYDLSQDEERKKVIEEYRRRHPQTPRRINPYDLGDIAENFEAGVEEYRKAHPPKPRSFNPYDLGQIADMDVAIEEYRRYTEVHGSDSLVKSDVPRDEKGRRKIL
jgi:hypothetical protein